MDFEDIWRRKFRINLETPRFVLRPLIAEDVQWLTELFRDVDVNRFLWSTEPAEARRTAEAVVFLDMHRSHFGVWAIQDKHDGVIVF